MKKFLPIIGVAAVVAAGIVIFALTKSSNDNKTTSNSQASTKNGSKRFSPPKACDVFTLDDAKKVLGDNAKKPDTDVPDTSSDDIEVSQCFYELPAGDTLASIKDQKQASILVRGAKTEGGGTSNKDVFDGSAKPAAAQDVDGYGDGAFWNPDFGQLNILKNDNWYILSVGPVTPSGKTLDDAKKLADILIDKL